MENILNFRKLAEGMKNAEGKEVRNIYRSADSSTASTSDIEFLVENKIVDIIDLRSENEICKLPPINDERITRVHINIINHGKQNEFAEFSVDKLKGIMLRLYSEEFVSTDGYADEMAHILSLQGNPFMFHCTAGKDRTGTTGAILMHIFGFTKAQIIEEYLKIDEEIVKVIRDSNLKTFASKNVELDADAREIVDDLSSIKVEFIEAYFAGVEESYGSFDAYVEKKLKLTKADIEKLKEYYLV